MKENKIFIFTIGKQADMTSFLKISSDGETTRVEGFKEDGEPFQVDLVLPIEGLRKFRLGIQPLLVNEETMNFDDPDLYIWSLKVNGNGIKLNTDGVIETGAELKDVKQKTLQLLHQIQKEYQKDRADEKKLEELILSIL